MWKPWINLLSLATYNWQHSFTDWMSRLLKIWTIQVQSAQRSKSSLSNFFPFLRAAYSLTAAETSGPFLRLAASRASLRFFRAYSIAAFFAASSRTGSSVFCFSASLFSSTFLAAFFCFFLRLARRFFSSISAYDSGCFGWSLSYFVWASTFYYSIPISLKVLSNSSSSSFFCSFLLNFLTGIF